MTNQRGYTCWQFSDKDRADLLRKHPPAYERTIAHHITHEFGTTQDKTPQGANVTIHSMADDGKGLQCLLVSVNGEVRRPDGSYYHCTWSLGPGRKPVESNELVKRVYCGEHPAEHFNPSDLQAKGAFVKF